MEITLNQDIISMTTNLGWIQYNAAHAPAERLIDGKGLKNYTTRFTNRVIEKKFIEAERTHAGATL